MFLNISDDCILCLQSKGLVLSMGGHVFHTELLNHSLGCRVLDKVHSFSWCCLEVLVLTQIVCLLSMWLYLEYEYLLN